MTALVYDDTLTELPGTYTTLLDATCTARRPGNVRVTSVGVVGREKDDASMLYNGERVGAGSGPERDAVGSRG